MIRDILNKVQGKYQKHFGKVTNMYNDLAESHYFDLYYPIIQKHLVSNSNILDIGCQYGRFTVPLANDGHSLTATDISKKYFGFIKSQLNSNASVEFHKEEIKATISREPQNQFDAVLCLELLYTMGHTAELLKDLQKLIKSGGLLITSHRTIGYYVYRYLKEKDYDNLQKILEENHPVFNAQTHEKLRAIYSTPGYEILEIAPIGMFSGSSRDPFTFISDPGSLGKVELKKLHDLENHSQLQSLFPNNARYSLVVARVGDKP